MLFPYGHIYVLEREFQLGGATRSTHGVCSLRLRPCRDALVKVASCEEMNRCALINRITLSKGVILRITTRRTQFKERRPLSGVRLCCTMSLTMSLNVIRAKPNADALLSNGSNVFPPIRLDVTTVSDLESRVTLLHYVLYRAHSFTLPHYLV